MKSVDRVLRQDDDGHWYRIPDWSAESFDSLMEHLESLEPYSDEWEDLNDNFIGLFEDYRLCGGPDSPYISKDMNDRGVSHED